MNQELFQKNKEFISNQIKFTGFENYEEKVDTLFASSEKEHSFNLSATKANFGNKIDYELSFKKGDNGMWFLNTYKGIITTPKDEVKEHVFAVKQKGITAMQALNLLEGRYSLISYLDKNKETQESFVRLNFDTKTENGNYKMDFISKDHFQKEDFQKILKESLVTKDQNEIDLLTKSLEKGNITRVKYSDETNGFAILNPKEKKLDLYDIQFKRIENESQKVDNKIEEKLNEKEENNTKTKGIKM